MKPTPVVRRGERGIALIVALLVLLVMSAIAIVLVASLNVETKLTGYSQLSVEALNTADAGLNEALARIRTGDVVDTGNPAQVTQIFLQPQGSVPVLGTDSLGMHTGQPSGAYLAYSKPDRAPDVLTIKYKTNSLGTQIYRFDKTLNPPVQLATGDAIYTVDVWGRAGNVSKHVYAEVVPNSITCTTNGAVSANVALKLSGSGDICGYNHRTTTPVNTTAPGDCAAHHETFGHLPAVNNTVPTVGGGGSTQTGSPSGIVVNPGSFPAGPWTVLNMTQSQFYTWIGPSTSVAPGNGAGLFYLDNNTISQDASGAWSMSGNHNGLIYADGDLTINAGSIFKGLIYVEGDIMFNGNAWILGGVIVRGKAEGKVNGGMTILYSSETIKAELSKIGGGMIMLAYREVPGP